MTVRKLPREKQPAGGKRPSRRRLPTGWALRAGAVVALLSVVATAWWFWYFHPAAKWQNRSLMAAVCILTGVWTAGVIAWRRWRLLSITGLNLLTVLLLTFSFAPWGTWILAYVALVPWTVALELGRRTRGTLWLAALTGFVFWAGNLYWITWVTPVGHAAGTLYLTLFWLIAAWGVRASLARGWPTWLTLPVLWVALEYARTYFIGFPWLFLAHSQYARTALIQISDLTGQYGVSFFVAMVNGLVADTVLSIRPKPDVARRAWRKAMVGGCVVAVTLAGLLSYGYWRLGQRTQSEGPVVALVQQAVPTTLFGDGLTRQETLELYRKNTLALAGAGCDLVVWPESVLASGNPDILQLPLDQLDSDSLRRLAGHYFSPKQLGPSVPDENIAHAIEEWLKIFRAEADTVGDLSAELGCPILTGNASIRLVEVAGSDEWVAMNDAMLLDGNGLARDYYSKVNLVPFGEYVPFQDSWPALYRYLKRFVPGVRRQLYPGRDYMLFDLSRDSGQWSLATPICYEGTFARVCRRMVVRNGRKQADILVNISNDGWFVYTPPDGSDRMSAEHFQHLVAYCFRAVENRVPVVRAVNTGISASIDSNGRIVEYLPGRDGISHGSRIASGVLLLDGQAGREGGVSHGARILVDSRVSRYSLIGDVFARLICVAGAIMLIWACLLPWRRSEAGR